MRRSGFPVEALLGELNWAGPAEMPSIMFGLLQEEIGATALRVLFVDVEERVLNTWGEAGRPGHVSQRPLVEGSVHGRVYLSGRTESGAVDGSHAIIAPVVARSERIGVLEVLAPAAEDAEDVVTSLGLLMGYVTIAADHWTDEFHIARRRQDMSLAAEMQWAFLPLAAFSTWKMALAGALEPAYDIAGDLFDYSCGREMLWVGIFDAMGHGVEAARLAALAISAHRNGRRKGEGLQRQAQGVHEALSGRGQGFVTGQLVGVNLADPSRTAIVNAGHPPPWIQRGSEPPRRVRLRADLPFGVPFRNDLDPQPLALMPGDRLVLFSDGMTEARPDGGEPFGEERLARGLEAVRSASPREAARRLIAMVLSHRAADLSDDATVLIVDVGESS